MKKTANWMSLPLALAAIIAIAQPSISQAASQARANENTEYSPPHGSREWMPYLNAGWGGTFKHLEKAIDKDKNYITWIIKSPDYAFDLRSPDLFRKSMLSTLKTAKGSISHMMIGWQCHDSKGRRIRGATGMTGENSSQSRKLIMGGWGISTFFAIYNDGELNDPSAVDEIMELAESKQLPVGHITVEVSQDDCQNMLSFLKKFLDHPNIPGMRFGLGLKPLKFEGGGCGSFASALLTKANVMPSVQPLMWRTVRANKALLGGGQKLPPDIDFLLPDLFVNRVNYVSFNDLRFTSWTPEDGPTLDLVDPEMGLAAFSAILQEYMRSANQKLSGLDGSAYGLRTVRSAKGTLPGAYNFYPINAKFDSQTAKIRKAAVTELNKLRDEGMTIRPVKMKAYWGLLISK